MSKSTLMVTLDEAHQTNAKVFQECPTFTPNVIGYLITATANPGDGDVREWCLIWPNGYHPNVKYIMDDMAGDPGGWAAGMKAEYDAAVAGHTSAALNYGLPPGEQYQLEDGRIIP